MKEKMFEEFRVKMAAYAKEEFGVDMEIGGITYSDNYFSFSSKVYNGIDGKKEEFERNCGKKGVPANWFMKKFIKDQELFQIVAIRPRGRKNTIEIKNVHNGKTYTCPKGFVLTGTFIATAAKTAQITQEGGVLV